MTDQTPPAGSPLAEILFDTALYQDLDMEEMALASAYTAQEIRARLVAALGIGHLDAVRLAVEVVDNYVRELIDDNRDYDEDGDEG